jgi:hypothetical protein
MPKITIPHSRPASTENSQATPSGHPGETNNQDEVAALAYYLWQARGCPDSSPDVDWYRAEEELRRANGRPNTQQDSRNSSQQDKALTATT